MPLLEPKNQVSLPQAWTNYRLVSPSLYLFLVLLKVLDHLHTSFFDCIFCSCFVSLLLGLRAERAPSYFFGCNGLFPKKQSERREPYRPRSCCPYGPEYVEQFLEPFSFFRHHQPLRD